MRGPCSKQTAHCLIDYSAATTNSVVRFRCFEYWFTTHLSVRIVAVGFGWFYVRKRYPTRALPKACEWRQRLMESPPNQVLVPRYSFVRPPRAHPFSHTHVSPVLLVDYMYGPEHRVICRSKWGVHLTSFSHTTHDVHKCQLHQFLMTRIDIHFCRKYSPCVGAAVPYQSRAVARLCHRVSRFAQKLGEVL